MLTQADLTHVYRALKLLRDLIEESPELINDEEDEVFIVAWTLVNDLLMEKYK